MKIRIDIDNVCIENNVKIMIDDSIRVCYSIDKVGVMYLIMNIPYNRKFNKVEIITIYEKIINLCDLMCTTKVLTVDKRMMDLLLRHGVFAKTHYHITETLKLKKYFDDKLGFNLYDLFPEIKYNL